MNEEQNKKELEEKTQTIMARMAEIIANAKGEEEKKAFDKPIDVTLNALVIKPTENLKRKEILGFPTYTFIDDLFLNNDGSSIKGLPCGSNSILVGIPNTGKSLILMEIALRVASSGTKVLFATSEEIFKSEFARYDLESRMKEKAEILGLSWQNIVQNLYVLDVITNSDLREWTTFVSTYRALIEKEGISLTLIDSLTLLEDTRGQLKYRLSELIKYNQKHGINAIYISQRSGDDPDSIGSLAGGIALSHIADIVFEMDAKKISSWDSTLKQDIPTAKQGTEVYFFKVLKNRLTRFNGKYIGYTITKDGLIKV